MNIRNGASLTIAFLLMGFISIAETEPNLYKWGNRVDAIQKRICNSVKGKCYVEYSAYTLDKNGLPVDNLDEIAFYGKVRFITNKDRWRDETYMSPVVVNPTWLDVSILANEMIKTTNDTHHIYLEDVEKVGMQGDVTILNFWMGS